MSERIKKILIITAVMLAVVLVSFNLGESAYYACKKAYIQNTYIPEEAIVAAFANISDAPSEFEDKTVKGTYENGKFSAEYEITVRAGRRFYFQDWKAWAAIKLDNGAVLCNDDWYSDGELFDYDGTYKLDMFYQHKSFTEPEGNFTVQIKANCNYPYAQEQAGFFNQVAIMTNSLIATLK